MFKAGLLLDMDTGWPAVRGSDKPVLSKVLSRDAARFIVFRSVFRFSRGTLKSDVPESAWSIPSRTAVLKIKPKICHLGNTVSSQTGVGPLDMVQPDRW